MGDEKLQIILFKFYLRRIFAHFKHEVPRKNSDETTYDSEDQTAEPCGVKVRILPNQMVPDDENHSN